MAYDASRSFNMFYAVTPSDTLENYGFGFVVGVSGNIALVPAKLGLSGAPVIIPVVAGVFYRDVAFCKIMATSTTATGIVAFGPT